ncbi:UNVERIFIED_CONTAM: hypothetical protein PYX00_011418 [Menopon gallinae]|uniref:Saccharopine dehydrogenase NADP binding domain-containing protein n=1 Tax=Menopon gallinae TaxID=328185 RepID=A0AAW2H7E4_9NEOP
MAPRAAKSFVVVRANRRRQGAADQPCEKRSPWTGSTTLLSTGAGGYAAKHIIRELVVGRARLALAGRNTATIERNIADVAGAERIPIIRCLPENAQSVARKTRLLLNCAGPYIFSGEPIVRACIDTGTHYMDITGETFFIEQIRKKYDEEARRRGVYVVNCCGFDSVPADIGVEHLKAVLGASAEITSVMRLRNTYLNRATYDSLIFGLQNAGEMKRLRNPQRRTGGRRPRKCFYNDKTGSYNVMFMGTDPSVVRRTQEDMQKRGLGCARYEAYLDVGGLSNLLAVAMCFLVVMLLSKFGLGRRILLRYPSLFTCGRVKPDGPSEDVLRKSSFEILFFGHSPESGKRKRMVVSGPDPGYHTTAICISQAALCLLDTLESRGKEGLPCEGGVLTPGSVFHGTDIVTRLHGKGIRFEILSD